MAIGIVGGGQLALMLAEAAAELGLSLHVQTPAASDPAVAKATAVVQAPLDDIAATRQLASSCRAISFENEWVDVAALSLLEYEGVRFVPDLTCLAELVSKRRQRQLLNRLNLPAPRWCGLEAVLTQEQLGCADSDDGPDAEPATDLVPTPRLPEGFEFPLMAKASSGGYDGKGTRLLKGSEDLDTLLKQVEPDTWILEERVAFELELAQLACRDRHGKVHCYPLVQTHQHQQVCDWVLAPAGVPHAVQAYARNIATSLLTGLQYVGMVAIELFYGPAGLQVNEIAPRTHNAGHFSIEACSTSQFAQQLRIVAGLPMGSTDLTLPGALMVNLLGFDPEPGPLLEARQGLEALGGATLHWYGKQGPCLGRKLGHITLALRATSPQDRMDEAMQRLAEVRRLWPLLSQG